MRTEIIYEDNDILVIYKPAGLATQTARVGQADVVSELKNYLSASDPKGNGLKKSPPFVGVIHRLDQPVEGLLVFAKTKQAAANLTAQLQGRGDGEGFNKHYYAVVCGVPTQEKAVLENFLYKDKDNKAVIVEDANLSNLVDSQNVKKAKLEYRLRKTVNAVSMVEVLLHTGRFHQIRAQMAQAGNPLLGDHKYGTSASLRMSAEMGVRNVALCAYRLEFQHPRTGKGMDFEIEPKGQIFALNL